MSTATSSSPEQSSTLVTLTNTGGLGNGDSTGGKPSSDGRYVAFQSDATNMVSGDNNGVRDVFVRDRLAGTTARVSVGASGAQANGASDVMSLSRDARYVVFQSAATNLVSGDTNGAVDIFRHDRTTGVTSRVSLSATGGQLNAASSWRGLSKNGRYVAFTTTATNVGVTTHAPANIYIRDNTANTTSGFLYGYGTVTPNGDAYGLIISDDGGVIGFSSSANNITQNVESGWCQQTHPLGTWMRYVHDTTTGLNTFFRSSAVLGTDNGFDMTPDGRYVVNGMSCITVTTDGGFFRYDTQLRTYDVVALASPVESDLSVVSVFNISDDGNRVYAEACFATGGSVSCNTDYGILFDFAATQWYLVTSNDAYYGELSGDGTKFTLEAEWPDTFDPIDTNNKADVYILGTPLAAQGALTGGPVSAGEQWGGCGCPYPTRVHVTKYPVDTMSGNFWHSFQDLAFPGRGPSINLTRTYNSGAAAINGRFGYGWSDSYGMSLAIGSTTVVVTQENGAQATFTLNGSTWTAPPRTRATLVHNGDGSWTFTRRAREKFDFDANGRLTAVRDLNGYTTALTYPTSTSAVVTDSAGRTLTFTLTSGRVTTATDSASRTLTYSYDGDGNLTDVIDVGNGHWQFTYDTSHRMLTMRSPRFYGDTTTTPSPVVTNIYDGQGRVTRQTDPVGRATNFDYTSVLGATKVTDPKGNRTLHHYNHGVLTGLPHVRLTVVVTDHAACLSSRQGGGVKASSNSTGVSRPRARWRRRRL